MDLHLELFTLAMDYPVSMAVLLVVCLLGAAAFATLIGNSNIPH